MAYEDLKIAAQNRGSEEAFMVRGGPYDTLSAAESAWNAHAAASLAKGQTEGLTLQDYNDFQRQMRDGKTPASTSARSVKMTTSSSGTKHAGVRKAKSTSHSSSSGYTGTAYSQSDVDRAVAHAVTAERQRVATVFASSASFGRERVCADLLASHKGFSGSAICAELANMPTDRDRDRQRAAAKSQKASAIWEKAIARNNHERGSAQSNDGTNDRSSNVWDQAIAKVYGKGN